MGGVAWNHHLLYSALNTCIKIIILALLFSSVELTLKDVKMKVLIPHSCLTLWDLTDCSSPGSSVHGILQARILESVAISFSRGSSRPRDQTRVSCIAGRFFTILTTREALESTLKDEFHQIVRVMEILRVGCHPFSQSKGFYLAPVFTVMDVSLNKNPLHFNQRS